jgi:hypothetical protein
MCHSTYFGQNIYHKPSVPLSISGSNLPWEAYINGKGFVYADTLTGIRRMIRRALGKEK